MAAVRGTEKRSTGGPRKRATGKRETLKTRSDTLYARRTSTGRFREMDEKGRSLATDRRRKAKTTTTKGYGDLGDRGR